MKTFWNDGIRWSSKNVWPAPINIPYIYQRIIYHTVAQFSPAGSPTVAQYSPEWLSTTLLTHEVAQYSPAGFPIVALYIPACSPTVAQYTALVTPCSGSVQPYWPLQWLITALLAPLQWLSTVLLTPAVANYGLTGFSAVAQYSPTDPCSG